jgi:GGDEF domain-containing protein
MPLGAISGCGAEETDSKLQKIVTGIHRIAIDTDQQELLRVSVKTGAAVYPADVTNIEQLVAAADRRLR